MQNNFIVLGISCFYHDSSAVIVKNGEILTALQEERFTRKKFDNNFPFFSINECLKQNNFTISEIDSICFYEDPDLKLDRIIKTESRFSSENLIQKFKKIKNWYQNKNTLEEIIKSNYPSFNGEIIYFKHHFSHAASAFYPSPFKSAAILNIDGVGEWSTSSIGIGNENNIDLLYEEKYPNSSGLLYSAFTQFCGFKVLSGEYKLMGLAPYGNPWYVELIKDNIVEIMQDGSINLNQLYFNYTKGNTMISDKFSDLFEIKQRFVEGKVEEKYMDIASSIQKVLEEIVINKVNHSLKITNEENLCMAGGVALNCVVNEKISKIIDIDKIWIQPAAGDSGGALGAALAGFYFHNEKSTYRKLNSNLQKGSYLGTKYQNDEIKKILDNLNFKYQYFSIEERNNIISKDLIDQKIIALFKGKMEFGPRALGSRSIIADPRGKDMQKKMNLKIKFRESFRPFAPAVLEDYCNDWFELNKKSPFMLFTSKIKKNKLKKINLENYKGFEKLDVEKSEIPAVTHVDFSARLQTVSKDDNYEFYDIIKKFYEKTNIPILINTSFNVRGEPIVNSPLDALQCFVNTNIDVLVLENYIIYKKDQNNALLKSNLNNIKPD